MYTIKLKNIYTQEEIHVIKSIFRVGRNPEADIKTTSNVVSKNHATLSLLIDGVYVQDHKSLNGTFINNDKVIPGNMIKLSAGDILGFGCNKVMVEKNLVNSPLIYEVILEYTLKQEPSTSSVKKEISFSDINDNNCIVISDDDENDKDSISNSQIFRITEKIKGEPLFNSEFDPYQDIKDELRDLDECFKQVEVDLTEENEACSNTLELLNILESSNEETLSKKKEDNAKRNNLNKELIIPLVKKTAESAKESSNEETPSKKEEEKNQTIVEISDNEIEIVEIIPKPKLRISRVTQSKGPPIIEPHIMQKKPTEKKEPSGAKRKNTKDSTSSKKLRTVKTPPPPTKSNTEVVAEEMKKKLRERTSQHNKEKSKTPSIPEVPKITKIPAIPKVKTSDSRGNFLLVPIDIQPSTSKRRTSVNVKTMEIQDSTIDSSNPIETVMKKVINTPTGGYNLPESSKVTSADRIKPLRPSNIVQLLTGQNESPNRNWNDCENVDDEVNEIVQWQVIWLMQQKNNDLSPPVAGDMVLRPVPNVFKNHQEYVDVMKPLLYLELWQFVYQSSCNKEELGEPMVIKIVHERRFGAICYLDCECMLYENSGSTTIRAEDIAMIEMKMTDRNAYVAFGFIKYASRLKKNHHFTSRSNFGLTVVTKNFPGKQLFDTNLILRVITNIGSSLRLLKTMKFLKKLPVCTRILNPSSNTVNPSSGDPLLSGMKLNEEQTLITVEASNFCLGESPGMYLMKGPPGTGKSTVIVSIIFQILFKGHQNGQSPLILLTSPSNAAIDGLILKIAEHRERLGVHRKHLKLIRMGPEASISKTVDKFKLSYFAQKDVLAQTRLQYTEEYKKCVKAGGDLNQFLKDQLKHEYHYLIRNAEEKILLGSNVICTTLKSCVGYRLLTPTRKRQLKFTCCIIDEATQCTELESLLPTQLGIEKFVLVGDPQQLPAVVCNKDAQNLGYGNSLFSRMYHCLKEKRHSPIRMLTSQYRMNPEICAYPSKRFYEGKLKSFPVCNNVIKPYIKPYLLFNLKSVNDDTSEYVNKDEAQFIYMVLKDLKNFVKTDGFSVGIIAPYKAQKELLHMRLSTIKFGTKLTLTVNTVDSFQGSENDVIIISCVRNNPNNFVQNEQRLNVALTRAKQALYIIGNYTLFKQCRPLYDLREDAKRRNLCYDINLESLNSLHNFIFV